MQLQDSEVSFPKPNFFPILQILFILSNYPSFFLTVRPGRSILLFVRSGHRIPISAAAIQVN